MVEDIEIEDDLEMKGKYWWLFGRSGGTTRIRIIKLLLERPYNANQLSGKLSMSYRNIKHHLILLKKAQIVVENSKGYGRLYLINPKFNQKLFNEIINNTHVTTEPVYT